jgi:hypothetical protein
MKYIIFTLAGLYEDVEFEDTFRASFKPTYTKISLNFYFGGSAN